MTRSVRRCRRLLMAAVVFAAMAAAAEERWTAVVASPRPSLPSVTLTVGEPGYASMQNTAIELKATAGKSGFDGYIGFHLAVADNRTLDMPVVARAVVKPHGTWTFRTWTQVRALPWMREPLPNRELAVQWRDRDMRLVAKKVAGLPPWSEGVPLRVVRASERAGTSCCLGRAAQIRHPEDLSTVAQWYSSFTDLVIETATWLDLPRAVREAAFSSGIPRVFIGAPRSGQTLDAIDRAVLAVDFQDDRWQAKTGATVAGSMIIDGPNAFVADASFANAPLPVTRILPKWKIGFESPYADTRAIELFEQERVVIVSIAVLLLTIVIALLMVRSVRVAAIAATLIIAVTLLACRDQLRLRAQRHVTEEWSPHGADGVRLRTIVREYGPTPIAEHRMTADQARLSVTGIANVRQEAELRGADTPPGHGAMYIAHDDGVWDETARWASRGETVQPLRITIVERGHDTMTFDYEAAMPVDFARARWTWKGQIQAGDARLNGTARGRATVHNSRFVAPLRNEVPEFMMSGNTRVSLVRISGDRTSILTWEDRTEGRPELWSMSAQLRRTSDGSGTCSFAIPALPPGSSVWIQSVDPAHATSVSATFDGVPVPLVKDENVVARRQKIDPSFISRIAAGGILSVAVVPREPKDLDSWEDVLVVVKEKR